MADDTIYRQAAIDALSMMQGIVAENGVRKGISMAWKQIEDLPSAHRTGRKKGKWVLINGDAGVYECDQCHERVCCVGKYCMNCGAKMEAEE